MILSYLISSKLILEIACSRSSRVCCRVCIRNINSVFSFANRSSSRTISAIQTFTPPSLTNRSITGSSFCPLDHMNICVSTEQYKINIFASNLQGFLYGNVKRCPLVGTFADVHFTVRTQNSCFSCSFGFRLVNRDLSVNHSNHLARF